MDDLVLDVAFFVEASHVFLAKSVLILNS